MVATLTWHCRTCLDRPEAMLGVPLGHGDRGRVARLHCARCDTVTDDQDALNRLTEWALREHRHDPGIADRVLGFADLPFELHLNAWRG